MIPDQIERETLIEAPVETVWNVVTEPDHIARWFSDAASIDLRPGGDGSLTWDGYGTHALRVVTVERPRLFAFRWELPEGEEPREDNSLLVEFQLEPDGENTRLRVVESSLDAVTWTGERKQQVLDGHSDGWARRIVALTAYAAELHGTPAR
ncbi:MAG TPA: SRPBCC domain-containing protein [Conexibacter sp.]